MSGHQYATIEDTVYFYFAANDTSGSGGDGASPLFDVREAGAAAGAIPLLSGTPTLLTHANYPAGCHEVAVAATTGNGFAADDTFGVFCTLAIDSQNPSGFVGGCTLTPLATAAALTTVDTVVDAIKVVTDKFVFTVANEVDSNVITKTGFSLASTGLDAISQAATGMVEIAKAVWDRVLSGATHNIATSAGRRLRGIQEFQGYENGAIWIDTLNGAAGTTDYENGTVENPVDSIADANTIAASLNINRFHIAPGSTITLAAAQNNQVFSGDNWALALGGQDIAGSHFYGVHSVTGTGIGASTADFHDCIIGTATLNPHHLHNCGFEGTLTFGAAGNYIHEHCYSAIAGSSTPIIDTGAAIGNVNLAMPNYFNGVEIQNLNNAGTDLFSISGTGQIIYAASSSGAVEQRGDWKVTNTGGVTITPDDNTANLASALADTNELQTDWTNGGRLDLLLDAIQTDLDNGTDGLGALKALIDAVPTAAQNVDEWETQSQADPTGFQANMTEVGGVSQSGLNIAPYLTAILSMLDDARGEPGQGAPPVNPDMATKIDWLYKAFRNLKDNDGSKTQLYNDAGDTVDSKQTTSEAGGTVTKAEWVSGP